MYKIGTAVHHVESTVGDIFSINSYPRFPPVLHHLVMFTDGTSPDIKFFGPSILTSTIWELYMGWLCNYVMMKLISVQLQYFLWRTELEGTRATTLSFIMLYPLMLFGSNTTQMLMSLPRCSKLNLIASRFCDSRSRKYDLQVRWVWTLKKHRNAPLRSYQACGEEWYDTADYVQFVISPFFGNDT